MAGRKEDRQERKDKGKENKKVKEGEKTEDREAERGGERSFSEFEHDRQPHRIINRIIV